MNMQDDTPTAHNPCDALRDLLPAYALGTADPDEARQIEALLAACPEWQSELAAYERLGAEMAALIPPVVPPPAVKARLMQAVADRPKRQRPAWGWIAAACLLIALIVSNAAWAALSSRQASLELVLSAQTDAAPDAVGRVLWTRDEPQAVLLLAGMPALPSDQTYQAWMRDGERIVSLGLIRPQPDGRAALVIDGALLTGRFDTVGVTVEPAGGSTTPSTPPIVRWQSG
ncbi:MAG: anti-sigma factor [Anaerolineae bacterium]